MDLSDTQVLPEAPAPAVVPATATAAEQCDQCGAPAERNQRYCVFCGAKRRHVDDPAARYLATGTSRTRTSGGRRPVRAAGSRWSSLGVALAIAVIPVAVGLGVLVGRASTGNDAKLIAALRAQKPEIINTGGGGGGATTTATSQPVVLSSTFPLQRGYSVELQTLPSGTTQSTVNSDEAAAKSKGATGVGLISQQDFTVKPSPAAGAYVIYSGAFTSKSKAEQALAKLKKRFPKAAVIQVQSVSASVAGGGQVLTKTSYGTANQITGLKVTKSQLNTGKQVVTHIQQTEGKSYVNAQRGLPSQISIP